MSLFSASLVSFDQNPFPCVLTFFLTHLVPVLLNAEEAECPGSHFQEICLGTKMLAEIARKIGRLNVTPMDKKKKKSYSWV